MVGFPRSLCRQYSKGAGPEALDGTSKSVEHRKDERLSLDGAIMVVVTMRTFRCDVEAKYGVRTSPSSQIECSMCRHAAW
eukprot:785961-Amphidinium_carterae.1